MTPDAPDSDASAPLPELFGPAWAERLERELAANDMLSSATTVAPGSRFRTSWTKFAPMKPQAPVTR